MGKHHTMLVLGENLSEQTESTILPAIKAIIKRNDEVKIIQRDFNTPKQVDIYIQGVEDTHNPDAFITSTPSLVEKIAKIFTPK